MSQEKTWKILFTDFLTNESQNKIAFSVGLGLVLHPRQKSELFCKTIEKS